MLNTIAKVLECPNCGAPLAPPRFARSVVCAFCRSTVQVDPQAVSASVFRQAFAAWNSPETYGITEYWSIGTSRWKMLRPVASGEISDVFQAERARRPSERVLLKVLRRAEDTVHLEREWEVLRRLQASKAPGATLLTSLAPQPVACGRVEHGPYEGRHALAIRWACGFRHTLESVRQAFPQGIDPRISIWVWRRILELLTALHRSGIVHGAVLPPHVLLEDGEHGARLAGYGRAGESGSQLPRVSPAYEQLYSGRRLTPRLDVMMSARCVAFALGSQCDCTDVPATVPEATAELVRRIAREGADDAWQVREAVGKAARNDFGPPRFCPLIIPS